MKTHNFYQKEEKELISINITPLIDIVFLLLVFFMLATSFIQKSTIEVNLDSSYFGSLSYFGEDFLTFTKSSDGSELAKTGWILGLSKGTVIENIIAGSCNDTILLETEFLQDVNLIPNIVRSGAGNDTITGISYGDQIYGESGDDSFTLYDSSFSIIDGGSGFDTADFLHYSQLENGLYSTDLRTIFNDGSVVDVEKLIFKNSMQGPGQILVSQQTFLDLNVNSLTITATWTPGYQQAIGVEGNFSFLGSFEEYYDIYVLVEGGQSYYLYVWWDHFVYNIDDQQDIQISLSNTILLQDLGRFAVSDTYYGQEGWDDPIAIWLDEPIPIAKINIEGLNFLNGLSEYGYLDSRVANSGEEAAIYSLSGTDADNFIINNGYLYFKPGFSSQNSYSITITVVSLTGSTVSKDFVIEVKNYTNEYTNAADNIEGSEGDDYLYAGEGENVIHGNAGIDIIYGYGSN